MLADLLERAAKMHEDEAALVAEHLPSEPFGARFAASLRSLAKGLHLAAQRIRDGEYDE